MASAADWLAQEFLVPIHSPVLIETALTHRSFVKQYGNKHHQDNERLEFLGDAVLKLVVSAYLFRQFAQDQEGELTKKRARLVSDLACAQYAKTVKLDVFLRLSTSEEKSGGRNRSSILGNAFEAVLGAIYLDQGIDAADQFFQIVLSRTPQILKSEDLDFKTQLQEWLQKQQLPLPTYELLGTKGPDHQKVFEIQVSIQTTEGHIIKENGFGQTKKEAEQHAAQKCLEQLLK